MRKHWCRDRGREGATQTSREKSILAKEQPSKECRVCSRKSKEANTDEEGKSQEPWSVISRGVMSSHL